MDKTLPKVTKDKDPKRVDAGRKGRENCMKKMKENILNDAKNSGGDTTNSSNETTSATNNASNETTDVTDAAITRSNYTYVYSVVILAVIVIGVCLFFAYNTSQAKNKEPLNEKQDQQPIQRPML